MTSRSLQQISSMSDAVAAFSRSLELPLRGAALAAHPAPPGDVPQLGEDLVHDQFVQEGAPGAGLPLQLVRRLLQTPDRGKDRPLLAHIAAVQPRGGAGKGQGLLVEEGVGGADHGVLLLTEQAGDAQAGLTALQLHPQRRLAAGAGQDIGGGGQLEDAPLHNDALAAGRAEIGECALGVFGHGAPPSTENKKIPLYYTVFFRV